MDQAEKPAEAGQDKTPPEQMPPEKLASFISKAAPEHPKATKGEARPCTMVIFGAAGDLTKRLLTPALYNLVRARLLPDKFALLGVDRAEKSVDDFRQGLSDTLQSFVGVKGAEFSPDSIDAGAWKWLAGTMDYLSGDFGSDDTFQKIKQRIEENAGGKVGEGNALFYLAVAPRFFGPLTEMLGEAGLLEEKDGVWRRVIIEKPFGHDLDSAIALNDQILKHADEHQVFRIDHFLGKETVQNMMVFRFANGFFEPLWNRDHIDHVQISAVETVGVEQRGGFYDPTGALRDMVPNHMFQLLTMVAMEPPNSFDADAVRTEKEKVLDAVHHLTADEAAHNSVRGQYTAGAVQGHKVADYRHEPNVDPNSSTETFVALKLGIDNWRWAGVPFYVRTGKSLAERRTEVAIRFKQAPFALFRDTPVEQLTPNWLVINVDPVQGISLEFGAKIPGPTVEISKVNMSFRYQDFFEAPPSVGYETLIYDCMIGDATLFQRGRQCRGELACRATFPGWLEGRQGSSGDLRGWHYRPGCGRRVAGARRPGLERGGLIIRTPKGLPAGAAAVRR